MDDRPEGFYLGTRNHLLVTTTLTVRGQIVPCGGRLADHLRTWSHPVVSVQDAEVQPHDGGPDSEVHAEVRIPLDHVLFAHEYVAMGGDPHLRAMHEEGPQERVRLVFATTPALNLDGDVSTLAREWQTRFMVVQTPKTPRGSGPGHAEVDRLPYVLVNRDRISAMIPLDAQDQDS